MAWPVQMMKQPFLQYGCLILLVRQLSCWDELLNIAIAIKCLLAENLQRFPFEPLTTFARLRLNYATHRQTQWSLSALQTAPRKGKGSARYNNSYWSQRNYSAMKLAPLVADAKRANESAPAIEMDWTWSSGARTMW